MISLVMDDLDFQLVTALQIHPRIAWTQLGAILNTDPSTLSRRWARLVGERVVWSGCSFAHMRPTVDRMAIALIEVQCAAGQREEAIRYLSAQEPVFSVNCTTGSRDLTLFVAADDLLELDRFIDQVIGKAPGVIATSTRHMRHRFRDGANWNVGGLTPGQVNAVAAHLPQATRSVEPADFHLDLIRALGDDVRRPASEVQRLVARSHVTVQRGIDTLLTADWARMRVDLAHNLSGWRAVVMMWLNVRHAELEKIAAAICLFPQVRLCASMSGEANLLTAFWFKDLDELDDIESKITTVFPRAMIADRWLVPRYGKRMGHVLDAEGRHDYYQPFGVHGSLDA